MKMIATLMLGSALLLQAVPVFAEEAVSCDDVVAAMEKAGDSRSPDQIAAQLKTTVKHVRECWDAHEAQQKKMDNPQAAPPKKSAY